MSEVEWGICCCLPPSPSQWVIRLSRNVRQPNHVLGNQIVARYKGKVGRRIHSMTLIADAKHSWLDAISSAGALTPISANGSSILAEANVVSMDVSPDGNWLLALDSDGVTIDEFVR